MCQTVGKLSESSTVAAFANHPFWELTASELLLLLDVTLTHSPGPNPSPTPILLFRTPILSRFNKLNFHTIDISAYCLFPVWVELMLFFLSLED